MRPLQVFRYTCTRTVSAVNVLVFVIAVFQCSYYKISLSSFQCFLCTIVCAVLFALFQWCREMDQKQVKEAKFCKRGRSFCGLNTIWENWILFNLVCFLGETICITSTRPVTGNG